MRTLHIIMPMAGEGSRFKEKGWNTPKPLIKINGKELFHRAIDSLKFNSNVNIKYSFIIRKEHIISHQLDSIIKTAIPNAKIFCTNRTTRGAVESCLIAESNIEDNEAVIIMDCDLEFNSLKYIELIYESLRTDSPKYAGGLLSFKSQLPKYSYAEVDSTNYVIRTAEKEVISDNALCGAYFFSNGADFKRIAHKLLNEANFDKPEYYISLLYNYLIGEGKLIKLAKIDEYYSYGTPDELIENI